MSGSCGDRAVCACVCMRHGCVSTACCVRCVVELHGVCCDPLEAASASCALVRVVGRPKLADRATEWGSVSSCSRSAALAIKTPCTHRCKRGQEKHIRQRVCTAVFERNSCLDYCSSSSFSICCVRLSVQTLPRADGRSQQEPMVDLSKSQRLIPVRADGRSQQFQMIQSIYIPRPSRRSRPARRAQRAARCRR
jgi:hypothetical protein